MQNNVTNARALLWALIILHVVMLTAMYTRTAPHPPLEIPLFALGPFFGAVLAIAAIALVHLQHQSRTGYFACIVTGALAMISFGPHKILAPEILQIWPAVLVGILCSIGLILVSITALRKEPRLV